MKNSFIRSLSLEKNNPHKADDSFSLEFDSEQSFISMVSVYLSEYLGNDKPTKQH